MIGAQKCNPKNPAHQKIMRAIIASHRKRIKQDKTDGHPPREEYVAYWTRPIAEIIKESKGEILVDSIPKKKLDELIKAGVLPALGNPFACLTGITAFRGKRIQYCELLPESVQSDAFKDRLPAEMLEYADVLEGYIPKELGFDYEAEKAKSAKVGFLEQDHTIPEAFWDIDALKGAVAWLRFWAQYPVKLYAWY